jgi:hypothetical protein
MKLRHAFTTLFLAVVFGLTACAEGTLPHRGKQHPGHPGAAEGYAKADVGALGEDARQGHDDHGGSHREAAIYTCPMHPEVVSSAPGTCPKCGMKLVPQPTPPKPSPSVTP